MRFNPTNITLPCPNAQILTNTTAYDTSSFLTGRYGTPLKDCRRCYIGPAPYLSSKSLLHVRILARLRLDCAPLNHPLHLRTLAPSPMCTCNNVTHETRNHLLLECPIYSTARAQFFANLT